MKNNIVLLSYYYVAVVVALLLVSATTKVTNGQEIGTEVCACTPSTYEFTLDFSLTCPPVNVTVGNAIDGTSCLTSPYGAVGAGDVNDLVPVSVSRMDILELGKNMLVVKQTTLEGETMYDGGVVDYSSITADPANVTAVSDVPKALQINLEGTNALGERIINVFIISFSNGCGTYPVFEEGQSAGWLKFTKFGPASTELCAAALSEPTSAIVTTTSPSIVPVADPVSSSSSEVPTDSPTTTEFEEVVTDDNSGHASSPDSVIIETTTSPSVAPVVVVVDDRVSSTAPTDAPTADTVAPQKTLSPTTFPYVAEEPVSAPIETTIAPADSTTTSAPVAAATTPDTIKPTLASIVIGRVPTATKPDTIMMSMSMSMSMNYFDRSLSLDDVVRRLDDVMLPTLSEFGRASHILRDNNNDNKNKINNNDIVRTTTMTKKNIRRRRI